MTEAQERAEQGQPEAVLLLTYADAAEAAALVGRPSNGSYEVVSCPLSGPVDRLLEELQPDLVILVPPCEEQQLLGACASLRDRTSRPIVVLSDQRDERVITRAFAAGVDEYLVLPVSDRELAARIGLSGGGGASRMGDLTLFASDLAVECHGRRIFLSPIEYRLLSCLASAPGKVFTHEALMARVWGAEYVDSRHYLHLYIRYLREKLEEDPHSPRLILNEWGVGYRFQPAEVAVR
jgi:DNA-binding response OmpR family regulator